MSIESGEGIGQIEEDGEENEWEADWDKLKARMQNTLIGEPSTPKEYRIIKKDYFKYALHYLDKLGIDPKTLSEEETDLLDQKISEVIKMYAKEPNWTSRQITVLDYWDQIINSWLIAVCGISFDELVAIQGYRLSGESLFWDINNSVRTSPGTPIIKFDTVEKRKQLAQSPKIVEYRLEQQLMRERRAESMGIVEGEKDKYGRAREIRERMQRLGKSEQEIKEELDRLFDRTGD